MKEQMAHNNVELCLEVEMEEGIKEILASPERCRSALLDVTVIKPKELEAFGTKTTNVLPAGEVKKLIASLERQKQQKKKQIDKASQPEKFHTRISSPIREQNHQVVPIKYPSPSPPPPSRPHYPSTRSRNPTIGKRENFIGESFQPLLGQIRKSLQNVEKNINNMHKDMSKDVLIYHQKREMMYSGDSVVDGSKHNIKALQSLLICKNNNNNNNTNNNPNSNNHPPKENDKCFCENCGIIGFIKEHQNKPIIDPELDIYPVNVSNKSNELKYKKNQYLFYIEQLTKKVELLEERLAQQEQKAVPKEYFKKIINRIVSHVTPKVFNKNDVATEIPVEIAIDNQNDKATLTDPNINSNSFWRWSGEILKPGIDLKNKIMNLLCDVFSKFSVLEKRGHDNNNNNNNIINKKEQQQQTETKVYSVRINNPTYSKLNEEKSIDFQFSPMSDDYRRRVNELFDDDNYQKEVNVSYINPNLPQWNKDSYSGNDDDFDDMANKLAKREFFKLISNTTEAEKEALWENIWDKAKLNGQDKENIVLIKISNKEKNSVYTAKFTLAEVENLLINHLKYRISPAKKQK